MKRILSACVVVGLVLGGFGGGARAQGRQGGTAKAAEAADAFAVVVLVADAELRARFEDGVVAKLDGQALRAVSSHGLVPDLGDLDKRSVLARLERAHVAGLLVLRPAALGSGDSLTSVRRSVTPDMLRDFAGFTKRVSRIRPGEAPAVVHIGVYVLGGREPMLLTAGATWLDADAPSRDSAVDRLENLVALNLDRAAPEIRKAVRSGSAGG